jgi:RNA polymerase sigma-70 factor (ECF subfamily)
MKPVARDDIEKALRSNHEAENWYRVADLAIRGYGEEIRDWLAGVLRNEGAAADVYSMFCEDLWNGLPGFRWQSSFRTWAFRLARHACFRDLREPDRKRKVVLDDAVAAMLPQANHSETQPWMKTDIKNKFAKLRDRLEPIDRMILILRVERQMSWEDVARIIAEDDAHLAEQAVAASAAALRQRFKRVKAKLREYALEEGIVPQE